MKKYLSLIFILALCAGCSTTPSDPGSCKSHDVGYLTIRNLSSASITVSLDHKNLVSLSAGAESQAYPVQAGVHDLLIQPGAVTSSVVIQRCQSVCFKYQGE